MCNGSCWIHHVKCGGFKAQTSRAAPGCAKATAVLMAGIAGKMAAAVVFFAEKKRLKSVETSVFSDGFFENCSNLDQL